MVFNMNSSHKKSSGPDEDAPLDYVTDIFKTSALLFFKKVGNILMTKEP